MSTRSVTLGAIHSHTLLFLRERKHHNEENETLTNTLIIRLDKLLNEPTSSDNPSERKDACDRLDFERRTVRWVEDANTPNCQVCEAKFSITRRRHHCRLCGKIVCATCSKFLSFISSRKLTNPAFAADVLNGFEPNSSFTNGRLAVQKAPSTLFNAGVESGRRSIQAVMSKTERLFTSLVDTDVPENPDEYMRICYRCKECLQRREQKMDLVATPSIFVDLYDKLCQLITQITNLTPSYRRMANSLRNG